MGIRAVERADVGVPAWWVDGDDEPCEAWLLFRVGIADETLLTRGITRLALQVARTGVRHHGVDVDLVVEGAYSGYHFTGDPDDVAVVVADLARPSSTRRSPPLPRAASTTSGSSRLATTCSSSRPSRRWSQAGSRRRSTTAPPTTACSGSTTTG